ncbi:MAG TPA: TlpA family protein disulfide reductase [Gallionellaceae bacterium]|nr:TlpA family protein disulfide reductase [Gallionellaceae bacterium]
MKKFVKSMCWIMLLAASAGSALAVQQTQSNDQSQPLVRGSYQKIIAAHAGKPFIVALWSVSCTHCGGDLEIFERLAQKYTEFSLVLISTDSAEQGAVISRSLKQYHLGQPGPKQKRAGRVESWVFADSYTERLRYEIDAQWYGELPRTYFYDANGKATGISGVLDADKIEQWLLGTP